MSAQVWVNGTMVAPGAPAISPFNHGFTVGDGVFETITVRGGQPFALTRHFARLRYDLERVGLAPIPDDTLRGAIAQVMASEPGLTRLRITVTAGEAPLGLGRGPGGPTVVVAGAKGVQKVACTVVRVPWRRNERGPLAGVKTTSYGENVLMHRFATDRGGDEGILGNSLGDLCEGTHSNVFVERGGEVLTPPLASGCLPGISRGLALEWGVAARLPVRVAAPGELPLSVLDDVMRGEAHLAVSSVSRGIQPVTAVDGVATTPGPTLARLRSVFEERAAADPDPAPPRRENL